MRQCKRAWREADKRVERHELKMWRASNRKSVN